ncbi:MAG: hypothetical protein WDM76_05330 [Limisphaerales bacterium]
MKNRILFFLTLAVFTGICRLAIASSDFYVSVYQQKVAPFTDEMLRVTTDPFGGSVVTEPVGINVITNGLGGAVLELDPDGNALWSKLDRFLCYQSRHGGKIQNI